MKEVKGQKEGDSASCTRINYAPTPQVLLSAYTLFWCPSSFRATSSLPTHHQSSRHSGLASTLPPSLRGTWDHGAFLSHQWSCVRTRHWKGLMVRASAGAGAMLMC